MDYPLVAMAMDNTPKNMTQPRDWNLEQNRPRVQRPEQDQNSNAQFNAGLALRQPL